MKYIIKIHRRNKLMDDVSNSMRKIFQDEFKDSSLVVVESIAEIESKEKLSKAQITGMEKVFLTKAKKIYKPETIDKVEIVPVTT